MRRSVTILVLALTTLVAVNLMATDLTANSAGTNGGHGATAINKDSGDSLSEQMNLRPDLDPRLEFVQWVPTSWVCVTPTFSCQMASPWPVGSSCYCPVWGGGVAYGIVQ